MLLGIASIFMLASMNATVRAQDLTGAGSTFINPIMTKWVAEYKKATGVEVNYQSVGSGAGINSLIDKTVDFAGSDAIMNADDLKRAGGDVLHLPVVIGTECIAYNVPGVPSGLGFSGQIIADIFLGKIVYWDDPQLVARNSGKKLPHEKIFTVHRSDGSGTTAIFTDYLTKVSDDWKTKVGQGKTVKWPNGLGGKGNEGVAGILKEHDYSIGYVELAYAVENNIAYGAVENSSGKYIYPTVGSGRDAAAGFTIPENFCIMVTNTPKASGYPIAGFTWVIVYQKSNKSAQLKKFLKWVLSDGQKYTRDLYYAPIPPSLSKREVAAIQTLQ